MNHTVPPHVTRLNVRLGARAVGVLALGQDKKIWFAYDPQWIASGFNLAPRTMAFDVQAQLARGDVFGGLHGAFSDSLPDGWGLLLMDLDILPALKDGDSFCKTAMSRRENVPCCIDVALVYRSAIAASPLSYSQTCSTFRTAGRDGPAARTSLGGVALVDYLKDDTGLLALVFQHRLQR